MFTTKLILCIMVLLIKESIHRQLHCSRSSVERQYILKKEIQPKHNRIFFALLVAVFPWAGMVYLLCKSTVVKSLQGQG